jgi:hypothetical protein
MKTLASAAAIAIGMLAGCQAGDDDYVTVPPGNGPPGEPVVQDAAPDARPDAGDTTSVTSTICVVTDVRVSTQCGPAQAGVTVRELGTANQTATRANGSFTLPVTGTGVVVVEIGVGTGALIPSLVPVTLGQVPATLPVASGSQYRALLNRLGPTPSEGAGDVIVYYFDRANLALPGVVVEAASGALNAPFYDVDGAALFDETGATGTFGAALILTIPAGATQVTARAESGTDLSLNSVPVADGHLTFTTARSD